MITKMGTGKDLREWVTEDECLDDHFVLVSFDRDGVTVTGTFTAETQSEVSEKFATSLQK